MKSGNISLIELMVLIISVSLFIALAIPSYKEYVVRRRMQGFWPIIEQIKHDARHHFRENNVWPNASELGFTATNAVDVDQPQAVHKHITGLSISPIRVGECAAAALVVRWGLNHEAIGLRHASTYIADLYLGATPTGYIASMCRETLDGNKFGNFYIGDVCTYNDELSFIVALCS